jgi:hypothetical protein
MNVAASAAVTPAAAAPVAMKSGAIDLDTFATLVDESTVTEKIDLGAAIVIKAIHLVHGTIILVNTTGAESAVMLM